MLGISAASTIQLAGTAAARLAAAPRRLAQVPRQLVVLFSVVFLVFAASFALRANVVMYWLCRAAWGVMCALLISPSFRGLADETISAYMTRPLATRFIAVPPPVPLPEPAKAAAKDTVLAADAAAASKLPARMIDKYTWEDRGGKVLVKVPALGPPAETVATCQVSPESFILRVRVGLEVCYKLEVGPPLYGTVDPRTSSARVDPDTGNVVLTLEKWFDDKQWKELVDPDPTAHPASKLALPEGAHYREGAPRRRPKTAKDRAAD